MSSDSSGVGNRGDLWTLVEQMRIEDPGASRTFEQALADETGWSEERARAVSREYRRFLYLAAVSGAEVTPSVPVDKAWHVHLCYTRHYWDVLCRRILGRPLHHRPSAGGAAEAGRHRAQYAATLALYFATFGELPPESVWPRMMGAPDAGGPAAARQFRNETRCGGGAACGSPGSGANGADGCADGGAGCGGGGCGGGCGGS
ncbi:MAG: hypothetical protein QOI38_1972 [Sphingomonadales bacterium]|jgi:hypothetical protein|nr:hypothetical protein [Sphingomonadales bacterium]